MSIRKAAVAGLFYEADPALLQQQISDLMSAMGSQSKAVPEALIVPHAGYIYSGPIAARAYSCLKSRQDEIRRVVLFGPAHRVYLEGLALPSVDRFETPLGEIALDREAIEQVSGMPGVSVSDQAHRDERLPRISTTAGTTFPPTRVCSLSNRLKPTSRTRPSMTGRHLSRRLKTMVSRISVTTWAAWILVATGEVC